MNLRLTIISLIYVGLSSAVADNDVYYLLQNNLDKGVKIETVLYNGKKVSDTVGAKKFGILAVGNKNRFHAVLGYKASPWMDLYKSGFNIDSIKSIKYNIEGEKTIENIDLEKLIELGENEKEKGNFAGISIDKANGSLVSKYKMFD